MKYKAVVLNQCTIHSRFKDATELSIKTWGSSKRHPDIKILNYFGGYDLDGERISHFQKVPPKGQCIEYDYEGASYLIVGELDTIDYAKNFDPRGSKQILALDYVYNKYDFDFIYRTGCTSYIAVDILRDMLYTIPTDRDIYEGLVSVSFIDEDKQIPYKFVIGANTYISRSVVEIVLQNRDRYLEMTSSGVRPQSYEDLCLGRLLTYELKIEDVSNFNDEFAHLSRALYCKDVDEVDLHVGHDFVNYRLSTHNAAKNFMKLHEFYENRV